MADFGSSLPIRTLVNGDAAVNLLDVLNNAINPAKEDGNLADVKAAVESIRDTSGIKKITDALPAGDNNIGDVDIASALPTGANVIGSIGLEAGTNNIGDVDIASIAAGDNNIGNVDIASELPAGTNVIGSVKVTDGVDDIAVNTNGSLNVNVISSVDADPVSDYDTAADIASSASSTHTYLTTSLFMLDRIWASASGKLKIEVKVGPVGSEVSKYVGFSSTSNPNINLPGDGLKVPSGQNILVIRTNLDNQTMDVYSTVVGQNI